ncbi:uncharacterized protein HMPREF1541_00713 [Cyphellophora europaea CBS 101466]|uniref:Uncharacterized protein n=1 Tax=Cyphellophora europaea (strain CBS 101466) TaxID=1220924 RepID=W2SES2_CYPE1|nr:uncharacterized protein HMPREF1541_00713 [Cyphellophora europaea CBS 101466]ETN46528.1 hypothetical protein HMPREF1541_00713 [Cyphellophora europaea CBS 101466]
MYASLLLPWSRTAPSAAETQYRAAAAYHVRTKGTIFLLPPPESALRAAFHAPPRPRTRMSAGAVALTKHFERNPAPEAHPRGVRGGGEGMEGGEEGAGDEVEADEGGAGKKDAYRKRKRREGEVHPYWAVPRGSNEEKTRVAGEMLERVLREARWRNVMLLHEGVAVYEVRVGRGWGMRWTLSLGRGSESECGRGIGGGAVLDREGEMAKEAEVDGTRDGDDADMEGWKIEKVTFRGFLEPIAGLDHELDLAKEEMNDVEVREGKEKEEPTSLAELPKART